jgi:hypothetical protein
MTKEDWSIQRVQKKQDEFGKHNYLFRAMGCLALAF